MIPEPVHSKRPCTEIEKNRQNQSPMRGIGRIIVAGILVALSIAGPFGSHVFAKSGSQATAQPTPGVDSHAIEALNSMGAYLRTLKAFQVEAALSTDDVTDDGQTIQSSSKVDLLASRPNRFRVEVTGDDVNRLYLYDGKSFTIWGQLTNFYATVPAPPTIPELIDKLADRYDIDLPLVDLFRWGASSSDAKEIKTAMDVGFSSVEGVTCEQYAFHQDNIDWQIWIQLGQYPLPRKLVIRTLKDEARPQHSEVLTWNLAPSFNDEAFAFDPPADAHRIIIQDMKAQTTESK